jgi:hypothetical protein
MLGTVDGEDISVGGGVSSGVVEDGGAGTTGGLGASSTGGSRSTWRSVNRAIVRPLLFSEIYDMWARSPAGEKDVRTIKDHLASWRHSAHTATNERRSKVIDGRIHDARRAEKRRTGYARNKHVAALVGAHRAILKCRASCIGTLLTASLPSSSLPSFDPRANLNNRHSSHSRRKMVRIARQGSLQGNPVVERFEGQFNEYRSKSGTGPSAGSIDAPRNFRFAFDAGRR